jgi:hypothetical protein
MFVARCRIHKYSFERIQSKTKCISCRKASQHSVPIGNEMPDNPIRTILNPDMSREARYGVHRRTIIHNTINSTLAAYNLSGNSLGKTGSLAGQPMGCPLDRPRNIRPQLFVLGV